MSETVLTALITLAGTALGTLGGIFTASKLTVYRLSQLEKKVDKHNHLVERMYNVEDKINILGEKQKVANHRIEDLEKE